MPMIGKDWYEWDSWEDFNTWHQIKIQELNLPKLSVNQATGEVAVNAQQTTAYTIGHEVENKIIAIVEDEQAEGLKKTVLRLQKNDPQTL
jgi:hypothetical protein